MVKETFLNANFGKKILSLQKEFLFLLMHHLPTAKYTNGTFHVETMSLFMNAVSKIYKEGLFFS